MEKKWRMMGILGVISVIIVSLIFALCENPLSRHEPSQVQLNYTRPRRNVSPHRDADLLQEIQTKDRRFICGPPERTMDWYVSVRLYDYTRGKKILTWVTPSRAIFWASNNIRLQRGPRQTNQKAELKDTGIEVTLAKEDRKWYTCTVITPQHHISVIVHPEDDLAPQNFTSTTAHRAKRATTPEKLTLNYHRKSNTTYQVDLCKVIACGEDETAWLSSPVYVCIAPNLRDPCNSWGQVIAWTGTGWSPPDSKGKQHVSITRGHIRNGPGNTNALLITITDVNQALVATSGHYEAGATGTNHFYLAMGVDVTGDDPIGLIKINLKEPLNTSVQTTVKTQQEYGGVVMTDVSSLSKIDTVAIETGYTDTNLWLDLMGSLNMTDCVMCSTARPVLRTVPSPLSSKQHFWCMLELHQTDNPTNSCSQLEQYFPMTEVTAVPPVFSPIAGNHTCITRSDNTGVMVGTIHETWCNDTVNVTSLSNCSEFSVARSDCWWYCGGQLLRGILPGNWTGKCTIVNLVMPVRHFPISATTVANMHITSNHHIRRSKRSTVLFNPDTFNVEHGSPVYIDAIGVPRGVPDEYKLTNQIAAGWESIFVWVTINKNVDRINYIHYNVQRLTNLTRDAIQGVAEQLHATSLMTYQTRLAVDFLLAEKGGVCAMFGDQCCTFIPNNTAPDGSVTKALAGLKSLSAELKEHSGTTDPLQDWLDSWFGRWGGIIKSFMMGALIAVAILVIIGCCCIPCARSLCNRMIHTALGPQIPQGGLQMPLLLKGDEPNDQWGDDDESVPVSSMV